jgi:NAD-dependent SIR2 family protein deacetylase
MHWYCDYCQTWRADTFIKIEQRRGIPLCKYCGQVVKSNLSDGEYERLWAEYAMVVPAPEALDD